MRDGPKQHVIDWRTFPEPSSFPLTVSLHWPLTVGDIAVFKGMQINKLNLEWCKNITGGSEWVGRGWGRWV